MLGYWKENCPSEHHDDLEHSAEISKQIDESIDLSRVLFLEAIEVEVGPRQYVRRLFHPLLPAVDNRADVVVLIAVGWIAVDIEPRVDRVHVYLVEEDCTFLNIGITQKFLLVHLHDHVERHLEVLAHVDALLDGPEFYGRLAEINVDLLVLVAPIIVLGSVNASSNLEGQVFRDRVTQLILQHEVLLLLVGAEEREASPLLKIVLTLLIAAEILRGALLRPRLLRNVPLLVVILVVVVLALDEQYLDVALYVLIEEYRLHMIRIRLVQQPASVVQVAKHHEHLELGVAVADRARLVEIQQTLRILHIVIAVVDHLVQVHEDVPDDEAPNEYREEASNCRIVRVAIFVEVQRDRVTEEILRFHPVPHLPQYCHFGLNLSKYIRNDARE